MDPQSPLRILLAALALFAAGLLLPARPAHAQPPQDAPYRAVATVGMVGDIVAAVAGDRARVETIIGTGIDPHSFAPSRGDVARMLGADIVFAMGLHLEGRMAHDLERVGRIKPVRMVGDLLPREILLMDGGAPDPHVWMDPARWMRAVDAVAEALAEFDPPHADAYRANAARYNEQLRRLDAYAREAFATIPSNQRVLITAHDAFSYMGDAYGIQVLGIQGISTESEAGLADINRLVDRIVADRIPAIFTESSVPDRNVRALVEGARSRGQAVAIGGELFSDAMGPAGTYEGTYIGMIDHNTTTIVRALGGRAPAGGMDGRLRARP